MKKTAANEEESSFFSDSHPRETVRVFGHEAIEQTLLSQYQRKTLPGAYMFCGPKGIGKATMAYRFARFLLSQGENQSDTGSLFGDALPAAAPETLDIPADALIFRRVAAGSASGLLPIEPAWDPKKKAYKSEIVADDARKISAFLSLTTGEGGWRVVIVDAADQLNTHAANAMLKWLEEPPAQSLFILIAHNPGSLLPTLRSRCRMLHFKAHEQAAFDTILTDKISDIDTETRAWLYHLSAGSPGIAIALHEENAVEIYQAILQQLLVSPAPSAGALFSLADQATSLSFEHLSHLLLGLLSRIIKSAGGEQPVGIPPLEQQALAHLATSQPLEKWLALWDTARRLLADAENLYLDHRQVFVVLLEGFAGKNHLALALA